MQLIAVVASVLVLAHAALAVPLAAVEDNEVEEPRAAAGADDWRLVYKVLGECAEKEMVSCLGVKAVAMLERAARAEDISLAEGVAFVRTAPVEDRGARALASEAELQNALDAPGNQDRGSRLIDMILDAATRFLKSHSLQLRLPQEIPAQLRALQEDGRGKKKKLIRQLMPLLLGVGAKLMLLLPLGIAAIGFLALKALLVSKLALVLGAVLAVQKLLGGKGGGGGSSGWSSGASSGGWSSAPAVGGYSAGGIGGGGWSSGGGGAASGPGSSSGWSRSIDAQQMAYAAQAPPTTAQ